VKVTELPFDIAGAIVSEEQLRPRAPGTHVSDIVKYLCHMTGRYKDDREEEELERFAVLGRLWERILAEVLFLPPQYERPGELERDGITGSPDCVDLSEFSVVEFKVTWVSSREDLNSSKLRHYLWQTMSYCHILAMTKARLIVLHMCGDWKGSITPVSKEYRLLFTEAELRGNWKMMQANLEGLRRLKDGNASEKHKGNGDQGSDQLSGQGADHAGGKGRVRKV
jgi:hypothetical protein